MKLIIKSLLFFTLYIVSIVGYAQKGAGETKGISRQQLNPELLKTEGTIEKIKTGPCNYTTGRSTSGTHLFVRTDQALINVHLGPTAEVTNLVSAKEGDFIAMTIFRTDKLPQDEYIAKEVIMEGQTIVLRDDTLKPVWSGKYRNEKWRRGN